MVLNSCRFKQTNQSSPLKRNENRRTTNTYKKEPKGEDEEKQPEKLTMKYKKNWSANKENAKKTYKVLRRTQPLTRIAGQNEEEPLFLMPIQHE